MPARGCLTRRAGSADRSDCPASGSDFDINKSHSYYKKCSRRPLESGRTSIIIYIYQLVMTLGCSRTKDALPIPPTVRSPVKVSR